MGYDGTTTRWLTLALYGDGHFTLRWATAGPGERLRGSLEPDAQGWADTLGPDWREAIGHAVTDVLIDRVQGA